MTARSPVWGARLSWTNLQLGHPEKRERASQFDTHEVHNSEVDALTHQIDGAMPFDIFFRRALRGHTTIWYGPLEEENAGHEGS